MGTKRHVSVSFGSLPSSCSEAEDKIEVADDGHTRSPASDLSPCDPCPELLRLPRPSLVLQQSTDSTDTATTTTENTQLTRRVSCQLSLSQCLDLKVNEALLSLPLTPQLGSKPIPSIWSNGLVPYFSEKTSKTNKDFT